MPEQVKDKLKIHEYLTKASKLLEGRISDDDNN